MQLRIAVLCAFVTGCWTQVQPGEVGVKIVKWGSGTGIDPKPYPVGMYWVGMGETMDQFPVSEQTYTWTKNPHEGAPMDESFSFQTKDGLQVNADIGATFHIAESDVIKVYTTYRLEMDQIRHSYLHNAVRDCLNLVSSTIAVESVYGEGKKKFLDDSLKCTQEMMAKAGITVDTLAVVGDFRLPEVVTQAVSAKIAATQKAQQIENEVKQSQAEAQKKVAVAEGDAKSILIKAEAQAQANILIAKSVTPELVQYKAIEAQMHQIDKWDGKMPEYMTGNSGGMLLTMPAPAKQ